MPDFEVTSADRPDEPTSISIPQDAVPIVPVRNTVLFPGMLAPITLSGPASIAAAQQAVREQRQIGVLLQQDPALDEVGPDDLYRFGTIANIIRYLTGPDDTHHIVCQGVQRMRVLDFISGTPFLTARTLEIPEPAGNSSEIEARLLHLRRLSVEAASLLPQAPRRRMDQARESRSSQPLHLSSRVATSEAILP